MYHYDAFSRKCQGQQITKLLAAPTQIRSSSRVRIALKRLEVRMGGKTNDIDIDNHTHTHYYQLMAEDAFERWGREGRIEVNIQEAAEFVRNAQDRLINDPKVRSWSNSDVKKEFEKQFEGENFAITGLAQIAKGEELIVAMTHFQSKVIETLWDVDATMNILDKNLFVTVESARGADERARLKLIFAKSREGRIVISQGLAKKLGINNDDEIKLSNVGQELSELDLDSL